MICDVNEYHVVDETSKTGLQTSGFYFYANARKFDFLFEINKKKHVFLTFHIKQICSKYKKFKVDTVEPWIF